MAGLTKQHFEAIAKIINRNKEAGEFPEMIKEFADYFKTQNPLFNENIFLKACLE